MTLPAEGNNVTLNDDNTRAAVRAAHDRVASFLVHFFNPEATWETFGKKEIFVEYLKTDLITLAQCVSNEVDRLHGGGDQDLGT